MRQGSWACLLFLAVAGLTGAAPQDLQAKRAEWQQKLAEPEPARRRAALREIVMWDPAVEETYDLVFQGLSDPDPETRILAGEILVRTRQDERALADLMELAGPAAEKDTRIKALMAITRVPEGAFDALETLRSYASDPDVGHVAQRAVEAVEVRRAWLAAQPQRPGRSSAASPETPAPPPAPLPPAKRGPGGELWLGLLALGYGVFTVYLRYSRPESLGKLEAMKERWGDETGSLVHWVAYSAVPILVGLALIVAGLRG
jgi:hypothetical protein